MKFPDDVQKALKRRFKNRHREWLEASGEPEQLEDSIWPLEGAQQLESTGVASHITSTIADVEESSQEQKNRAIPPAILQTQPSNNYSLLCESQNSRITTDSTPLQPNTPPLNHGFCASTINPRHSPHAIYPAHLTKHIHSMNLPYEPAFYSM